MKAFLGELIRSCLFTLSQPNTTVMLGWLEAELPIFFTGRILPVDAQVADRWGRLVATASRPLPAIDSLLAATAAHHGLSLVTRNVRNFADLGLEVINPWSD
ncbi:MAG: PIN domain-containing protein [Rugosibacter sp.]